MGVVDPARDERLDRTVALKTIRGETDDTSRQRMWREARAAAGISHPHICQLYEVEETDDGLVMAMELLAGESLGARVARGRCRGRHFRGRVAGPRRSRRAAGAGWSIAT